MELKFSCNQPAIDKLVRALVALGDVEVPRDAREGLNLLSVALGKIQRRRSELAETESRLTVHCRLWQAEVSSRDAAYRIKLDDMLLNDPEVRVAPNKEARMARARARAIHERQRLDEARKEHAALVALLEVAKVARDNLKNAKESISAVTRIAEMELINSGMPTRR